MRKDRLKAGSHAAVAVMHEALTSVVFTLADGLLQVVEPKSLGRALETLQPTILLGEHVDDERHVDTKPRHVVT